jgi:hypothetical protein
MRIIRESDYNNLISQLGKKDSNQVSFGNSLDSWLSDTIVTVELTGNWEQDDDSDAYTAKAKYVSFDNGKYTIDEDDDTCEITIYDPSAKGGETPSSAIGDRVSVVYRGRWELLGSVGTSLFVPVNLEIASGLSGDSETMCSFNYFIQHCISELWWGDEGWGKKDDRMEYDLNKYPSKFRRTSVGRYVKATFGHAHTQMKPVNENDDKSEKKLMLVMGWTNEVPEIRVCV